MEIFTKYTKSALKKRQPIYATLELTQNCNFSCMHCYLGLPETNRKDENIDLSTEEWKKIIDKVAATGIFFVVLTGGEVFLRSDALELIEYIVNKGLIVSVFSNGSFITHDIALKLKKMKIFCIAYSLHSPTPEIQDKISGTDGSYDKILSAIKISKEVGLHTILKASIGKINLHQIDELIKFADDMDVPLELGFMTLADRFGNVPLDFQITDRKELSPVIKKVMNYNKNNQAQEACKSMDPVFKDNFRCSGLFTAFCVESDGFITPCPGIDYKVGSLLIEDFDDIWYNDKAMAFACRKMPEMCAGCEIEDICSPCPAYSLNTVGDFNKTQDFICNLNKELHYVHKKLKKQD
ncbi:radical SAM protein [bacterium]|nr:radical SAM protein [bacterium]